LQNAPGKPLELPGLQLIPVERKHNTSKFDLTLSLTEFDASLAGAIEYNTDLFDPTTISRFITHYQNLLEAVSLDPSRRLSDFCFLSDAEKSQLVAWNETARDYPDRKCIHQIFEEQVQRTPDAVALIHGETNLTYFELNRRANHLAHSLRRLGVGPEARVGLMVRRSPELLIGLLGILKSGAAYLPLDPAYPVERLAFMLRESGAGITLTQAQYENQLQGLPLTALSLDSDFGFGEKENEDNPDSLVSPENTAYVMYTSGSTGQPKGVEVAHGSVIRLLFGIDYVSLGPDETLLHLAPISFDASTFEIWGALLHGAQCVLYPEEILELQTLRNVLVEHNVSTLWLTASLFNLIIDESPQTLSGVRQLLIGGEALSAPHVSRALDALPSTQIINGYGPTESTTFTCCYQIPRFLDADRTSIPIGYPISNTQVYILDERMNPLPIGVYGQLYVGGQGLAKGYVNCPELTAEKFVPNPFSKVPGDRLYRTGDLARYLLNGAIDFYGRVDTQVKIRGFRIEPGEISAVLCSHPAVQDAVVIAREEKPGNKRLIAYVVTDPDRSTTVTGLHQFLAGRLPEYMIPSMFIRISEIPLNANGKLVRELLPDPALSRSRAGGGNDDVLEPRTPLEELIATLWSEVLKVERVCLNDNFFDLGGHSLLAMQVVARIRNIFKIEMPLRRFFESPNIAELAWAVEESLKMKQSLIAPPIRPSAKAATYPLSFAQQRLWLLDQIRPGEATYNVPVAIRLRGQFSLETLSRTLTEIRRRHEVLRTVFDLEDGQPVQKILPAEPMPFSVVDCHHLGETERESLAERLVAEEIQKTIDLRKSPVLPVKVLKLSQEDHIVIVVLHHIVADGWSMGVLVKEVMALYTAYSEDSPSPLPELEIQYADYAVWEREWLQGEVLDRKLDYWREQLAGAPSVLELPTSHPRPITQSHRGASLSIVLDAGLTAGLRELSRREGATLFMTLLAAYQTLLYRYGGQSDLVIGAPFANRNQREVEPLIGFFVNTLALRGRPEGDKRFTALLNEAREATLGAYAHQDLPFEKLVEELQIERSLSHHPLFQAVLTLQNAPTESLSLPGLELSPIGQRQTTSKFDLSLNVIDTSQNLMMTLEYNIDIFEAPIIERQLGHFKNLLRSIVCNPQGLLSELEILSDAEMAMLQQEIKVKELAEGFSF